jgi:hypothetical protein
LIQNDGLRKPHWALEKVALDGIVGFSIPESLSGEIHRRWMSFLSLGSTNDHATNPRALGKTNHCSSQDVPTLDLNFQTVSHEVKKSVCLCPRTITAHGARLYLLFSDRSRNFLAVPLPVWGHTATGHFASHAHRSPRSPIDSKHHEGCHHETLIDVNIPIKHWHPIHPLGTNHGSILGSTSTYISLNEVLRRRGVL